MWKVWTRILVFSLLNPNLCPRSSGTVNVFYDELLMNEDSDNKVSKRGKKQVVNLESLGVMNKEAIFCSVNRFANCLTHWAWTTGSSTRLKEVLKIIDWSLSNRQVENKKQNEQVKHQLKPSRMSVPSSWLSCQNQRIRESLRRSRTRANREEQHHQRSQWVKQRMSWGQDLPHRTDRDRSSTELPPHPVIIHHSKTWPRREN